MTFELRPYQHDAEQAARIALAGGAKRVVLYLPTGGGKTLTAISIIKKAGAKGRQGRIPGEPQTVGRANQ